MTTLLSDDRELLAAYAGERDADAFAERSLLKRRGQNRKCGDDVMHSKRSCWNEQLRTRGRSA